MTVDLDLDLATLVLSAVTLALVILLGFLVERVAKTLGGAEAAANEARRAAETAANEARRAADDVRASVAIIKELGFQNKDQLTTMEAATAVVASDLEASHKRANEAVDTSHGAAADAAMRTDGQ